MAPTFTFLPGQLDRHWFSPQIRIQEKFIYTDNDCHIKSDISDAKNYGQNHGQNKGKNLGQNYGKNYGPNIVNITV